MGRFGLRVVFGFGLVLLFSLFSVSAFNVLSNVKISDGLAGFSPASLDNSDYFGGGGAAIGDLNGDGVFDLAVGAYQDENETGGDSSEGAVYILFMNVNGSVNSSVKITDGSAGFNPVGLDANDQFGNGVANIGDLDGDGTIDLAVGAVYDENIEISEGAVYILFMNANGTVKNHTKISDGLGGFYPSALNSSSFFGASITGLGDLDSNGVLDIAVGAYGERNDTGGDLAEGAVYVLFINTIGRVNSCVKFTVGAGGFTEVLGGGDYFGSVVANQNQHQKPQPPNPEHHPHPNPQH